MSLLVVGGLSAMMCNGQSPLQNAFGQVQCSAGVSMPNLPNDATTYMAMAAAADLFEIQSGQLAQAMGMSLDARSFGTMLINDHTQTTATLKAAASSAGLLAPIPILSLQQQQMLSQLQLQSGASFDQLFWQQQLTAHEMALALHSNYAANGDTPALRSAAASAVSIVQMHLNKILSELPNAGACPSTYWCNADVDALGNAFSVCCPSNIFPLFPSISISSPYFSASVAPVYTAPAATPIYSSAAPVYSAPVYNNPVYAAPVYSSWGR